MPRFRSRPGSGVGRGGPLGFMGTASAIGAAVAARMMRRGATGNLVPGSQHAAGYGQCESRDRQITAYNCGGGQVASHPC